MLFLSIFVGIILIYGLYRAYRNTHQVTINHVNINENSNSPLPMKVLHISDLHLENISVTPTYLYEQFKHESFDIIALTGDFLDRKRSIPKLIPYLEVFQQLNPKHGTYAVFGNHDYVLNSTNFKKLKETLEQYNVKTMKNENESIIVDGTKVNIIGIDDFSTKRSDLASSYKGLGTDGYNLVLTHDPNIVLTMDDYHFDYLLSGHFHGGQIHWPKPYHLVKMGKLARMNMVKGLQYFNERPFYISEGLGQTGVNIRVGSRPEITIHQFDMKAAVVKKASPMTAS